MRSSWVGAVSLAVCVLLACTCTPPVCHAQQVLLWEKIGSQGIGGPNDGWYFEDIDLSMYAGGYVELEFTHRFDGGNKGDLAFDDLKIYNSETNEVIYLDDFDRPEFKYWEPDVNNLWDWDSPESPSPDTGPVTSAPSESGGDFAYVEGNDGDEDRVYFLTFTADLVSYLKDTAIRFSFWWHKYGRDQQESRLYVRSFQPVPQKQLFNAYEPSTGPKPAGRSAMGMTRLSDTQLLIFGGLITSSKEVDNSVIVFNSGDGSYDINEGSTSSGDPARRGWFGYTVRPDGNGLQQLMYVGGVGAYGDIEDTFYQTAGDPPTSVGELSTSNREAFYGHMVWRDAQNTRSFVYGGILASCNDGECTDVVSNDFYQIGSSGSWGRIYFSDADDRAFGTATLHPGQRQTYIVGGLSSRTSYNTKIRRVPLDKPSFSTWTHQDYDDNPDVLQRYGHSTSILGDSLWIFGGKTLDGDVLSDLWQFRIPEKSWQQFGVASATSAPIARYLHSSAILSDAVRQCARLYVYGGSTDTVTFGRAIYGTTNFGLSVLDDMRFVSLTIIPEIASITSSGCGGTDGNSVSLCPQSGQVPITISGAGFSHPDVSAVVGDTDCPIIGTPTFNELRCTLPAATLSTVDVRVSICDLDSNSLSISYEPFLLQAGTLKIFGSMDAPGSVTLPDTAGGTVVEFEGLGFGTDENVVSVGFGTPSNPQLFACALVPGTMTNNYIRCVVGVAVGAGLVFQVTKGVSLTNVGEDTLSHPTPIIYNTTLEIPGLVSPRTDVLGSTTQGEIVRFQGLHFGNFPEYVYAGLAVAGLVDPTPDDVLPCQIQPGTDTDTITCFTSPGEGVDLVFYLSVGPPDGALSDVAEGTDTYTYPTAPTITSVSGCTDSIGGVTEECPTKGGNRVEVSGTNIKQGIVINIGGRPCLDVVITQASNDTSATCILPPGAGLSQAVVGSIDNAFSRPKLIVSYSPPFIVSLSGCEQTVAGGSIEGCAVSGGDVIVLRGDHFGEDDSQVLVGGLPCTNLTHSALTPHKEVSCVVPAATGSDKAVLLLQPLGEISPQTAASPTLSYVQCQAGQYQGQSSCEQCEPGTFSAATAQEECTPCDPGRYNNAPGQVNCVNCPPGNFTASFGQTECRPCPLGQASEKTAALQCEPCDVGKYSSVEGATSCINCDVGKFAAADETEQCEPCQPGTATSRQAASRCDPCPAGTYANTSGLQECIPCGENTFAVGQSNTECTVCPQGRVSSTLKDVCLGCDNDQYLLPGSGPGQVSCGSCPVGVRCSTGVPVADDGYWIARDTNNNIDAIPCVPLTACVAGGCGSNREPGSVMCGDCAEGYYEWGGSCEKCDSYNVGLLILIVLAGFAYLFVFYHISQSTHGETKIFLFFVQMGIVLVGPNRDWTNWMGIFDFDVLSRTTVCIAPWSPLVKLFVVGALPFFSMSQLLFCTLTAKLIQKIRNKPFDLAPFTRTLVGLFVFSYNSVTISTLAFFNCQDIPHEDGTKRMVSAPSVDCQSSEYNAFTSLAIALMLIFVIGIPFGTMFGLIWLKKRRAHMLSQNSFRASWGVLFDVYTEKHYLWEIFSLSRRVILIACTVIWSNNASRKFSGMTTLLLLFYLVQQYAQPYVYTIDNRLEAGSLSLLLLLSAILSTASEPLSLRDNLLILFLFVLPAILLLGYLVYARVQSRLGAQGKGIVLARPPKTRAESNADDVEMTNIGQVQEVKSKQGMQVYLVRMVHATLSMSQNNEVNGTPFDNAELYNGYADAADDEARAEVVETLVSRLRSKDYFARVFLPKVYVQNKHIKLSREELQEALFDASERVLKGGPVARASPMLQGLAGVAEEEEEDEPVQLDLGAEGDGRSSTEGPSTSAPVGGKDALLLSPQSKRSEAMSAAEDEDDSDSSSAEEIELG